MWMCRTPSANGQEIVTVGQEKVWLESSPGPAKTSNLDRLYSLTSPTEPFRTKILF